MVVHTVLPDALTSAVAEVLAGTRLEHTAHPDGTAMAAAEAAASDERAVALIGPYRSREVADAVEATAPRGLPLLAPVATWVGVTRDDEPGCDHPADHRGTVFRMVARDLVVAERIARMVEEEGQRAWVVAGEHEYGVQLDSQLRMAGLPRAAAAGEADLVVLCGLAGRPEIADAAALGLPVVAFDGAEDPALGDALVARPFAPGEDLAGVAAARRAAQLVAQAGRDLGALRAAGPFDEHGDPVDAPVWLYRGTEPVRALP
jgi:hypothetical protein